MELELLDKSSYDKASDKTAVQSEERYEGPERRVAQRRSGHDRRAMVRFELGKEDRRQLEDRRKKTNIWDKGHTMF